MRVLWFTNIPLPAVQRRYASSPIQIGGWLESLRLALSQHAELELGIASVSQTDYAPFCQDGVTYFNLVPPLTPRSLPGEIQGTLRRWNHPIDFPNAIQQCNSTVNTFKPDVIHVHGSEGFFGLIQQETNIPVVLSLQGFLTVIQKFFFQGLTVKDVANELALSRFKFVRGHGLIHNYWTLKRAARREQQILKLIRYFIGRTDWDKGIVSFINPSAKYFHCDEVLRDPFYSTHWQLGNLDAPTVYCTSGPSPIKGLDCLLGAIAIVREMRMPNLQLRIAGDFEKSSMGHVIQRHIKKFDLPNAVTLLGSLDAQAVARELSCASVFVLPSYIENSPNSLAEAMLVGTPCIASYVGGIPSLLRGSDGIMFPAGDSYALADQIVQVLSNPTLALSLSANAQATARRRHDPQIIANEMMEVYNRVAQNVD